MEAILSLYASLYLVRGKGKKWCYREWYEYDGSVDTVLSGFHIELGIPNWFSFLVAMAYGICLI